MHSSRALSDLFYPHGNFRGRVLFAVVRDRWFIRLRWIIIFATLVILGLEHVYFPSFRRPPQLFYCVLLLASVNVAWMLIGFLLLKELAEPIPPSHERSVDAIDQPMHGVGKVAVFVNAQMFADLFLLTAMLRFSGGIENPMAVFYVFHMLLAALLLRPVNAFLQGVVAILLYAGLLLGESTARGAFATHYPFLGTMEGLSLHLNTMYVWCAIGVLAAGIFGTLFFTLRISSRLDTQERDLEQANEALTQSRQTILDLQKRRSRFMQVAAHQLKSPVAGIEMLANLIRDRIVENENIPGIVDRIIERCRGAIGQVGELLTLARIEDAAPARHQSSVTDLQEAVEHVVNKYRDQANGKRIALTLDTSGCQRRSVCVEARDLEDCISNLVENAIKYTQEGGEVRVSTECNPKSSTIRVKDNGMGIAEASEDALFDPFRRGKLALAKNIPGTGLGLAIVREVVEQAHGRITVHSTVGKGSEFVISLPRPDSPGPVVKVRGTRQTTIQADENQQYDRPSPSDTPNEESAQSTSTSPSEAGPNTGRPVKSLSE